MLHNLSEQKTHGDHIEHGQTPVSACEGNYEGEGCVFGWTFGPCYRRRDRFHTNKERTTSDVLHGPASILLSLIGSWSILHTTSVLHLRCQVTGMERHHLANNATLSFLARELSHLERDSILTSIPLSVLPSRLPVCRRLPSAGNGSIGSRRRFDATEGAVRAVPGRRIGNARIESVGEKARGGLRFDIDDDAWTGGAEANGLGLIAAHVLD